MRQERIEIFERFGSTNLIEDMLEVGPGFETVGLGGFDETVEAGAGFGAMLEHAHELLPLSAQIRERRPGQALRHDGAERHVEPLAQIGQDRKRTILTNPIALFCRSILHPALDRIELLNEA